MVVALLYLLGGSLNCASSLRSGQHILRMSITRTVGGWDAKTPQEFIFSAKVPQVITHEKVLVGCDTEFTEFLNTMGILEEKLGPMVLQFPHFSRDDYSAQSDFLDRLIPFLKKLPKDRKFGVEIRNKEWLDSQFAGVMRDFRKSSMPDPRELSQP